MSNLIKDSYRYYFKIKDWLPTELNLTQAFSCIQQEERDRIQKFHFKEDFKSSLIGRLLLRKIVKQRFNLNNREIKFSRNEHGRPVLSDGGNDDSIDEQIYDQGSIKKVSFDYNISHHGDYCVAVGENVSRIGVDVMRIEKRSSLNVDKYFKLMNRNFTSNEWSFINANSSENERIRRFIRLWTLKESFVKADGCGLTLELKRINFNCRTSNLRFDQVTNDTVLELDGRKLDDWTFIEYLLDDHYCVAIAINKPSAENKMLEEIKFDSLIHDLEPLDYNSSGVWDSYSKKGEKKNLIS